MRTVTLTRAAAERVIARASNPDELSREDLWKHANSHVRNYVARKGLTMAITALGMTLRGALGWQPAPEARPEVTKPRRVTAKPAVAVEKKEVRPRAKKATVKAEADTSEVKKVSKPRAKKPKVTDVAA